MSSVVELPDDLAAALAEEAARAGVPLSAYATQLLTSARPDTGAVRTGADLVAYWRAEGLIDKVDERVRVVLPARFKDQVVSVEEVGADEVRVRIVKPTRRRPALAELLAGVTADNRHDAVDFGPPCGNEAL